MPAPRTQLPSGQVWAEGGAQGELPFFSPSVRKSECQYVHRLCTASTLFSAYLPSKGIKGNIYMNF